VELQIADTLGSQILSSAYKDTIRVDSREDDPLLSQPAILRFEAYLRPGNYSAHLTVTDLETGAHLDFDRDLAMPDFRNGELHVSDPQLGAKIFASGHGSVLVKNGREIVPNVSRVFGAGLDTLFVYSEIYNLVEPDSLGKFSIAYFIRNAMDETVRTVFRIHKKPGKQCAVSLGIAVADLAYGPYTLIVRVKDLDSRKTVMIPSYLTIATREEMVSDVEYERLLRQLKYIANSNELKGLKSSRREDRVLVLNRFWESRNPLKGSGPNEFKHEFFRRLAFTNDNFFNFLGEGWESDQGRIYIQYGPPDYIDRQTGEFGSDATYQVWFYGDSNRRFYFVDDGNFGEYKIIDNFETISEISFH
jgi:GWxTD domain-containing protein